MGQQQLLIVILVTIIIGIASLVAFTTFESSAKSANKDALTLDVTTLASSAQEYYLRPEPLGGGGRTFGGFTIQGKLLPVSGISADGFFARTENGTIQVASATNTALEVIAHPSSCEGYQPGTVDEDGILTNPGLCGENDQITATVGPGDVTF